MGLLWLDNYFASITGFMNFVVNMLAVEVTPGRSFESSWDPE
jgi:hypothetical protein